MICSYFFSAFTAFIFFPIYVRWTFFTLCVLLSILMEFKSLDLFNNIHWITFFVLALFPRDEWYPCFLFRLLTIYSTYSVSLFLFMVCVCVWVNLSPIVNWYYAFKVGERCDFYLLSSVIIMLIIVFVVFHIDSSTLFIHVNL